MSWPKISILLRKGLIALIHGSKWFRYTWTQKNTLTPHQTTSIRNWNVMHSLYRKLNVYIKQTKHKQKPRISNLYNIHWILNVLIRNGISYTPTHILSTHPIIITVFFLLTKYLDLSIIIHLIILSWLISSVVKLFFQLNDVIIKNIWQNDKKSSKWSANVFYFALSLCLCTYFTPH